MGCPGGNLLGETWINDQKGWHSVTKVLTILIILSGHPRGSNRTVLLLSCLLLSLNYPFSFSSLARTQNWPLLRIQDPQTW